MAHSSGFSAPVDYFELDHVASTNETGLRIKSSQDGATGQEAEASNEYGDTVAHDEYGQVLAPSCEYAVIDDVDLSDIALGKIVTKSVGGVSKKFMITQVQINTSAGGAPTVSVSGVEVDSAAVDRRTYELPGTLSPRHKSQDPFGALTADAKFTQINSTAAVDAHVQTVTGAPVFADASHCVLTVQATMTDHTGSASITAATNGGFEITAPEAMSNPDSGYIERTATLTKYLTGTEASS